MKLANVSVQINKFGSSVALSGVSPLEAVILTAEHHQNVGKPPVQHISDIKDIDREDIDEVNRLREKYGAGKVEAALKGTLHKLPADFDSAATVGVSVKMPSNRLVDFKV